MMRLFILVVLMLSTACAPRFDGRGELTEQIRVLDDRIITRDGEVLLTQTWQADHPKAIIVGIHGFNDYAEAFYLAGPWWKERGITTIAYDQRGFGRSKSKGRWPGGAALQADLKDVVGAVQTAYPDKPIFLVGLSMGGAVVLTTPMPDQVTGQVLVGPAVWGWQTLNPLYSLSLSLSARLFPAMELTGKGLGIMPSDNIPMLRKISKDPLMIRETRTDAIYGLVGLMDDAFDQSDRITIPSLLLYGDKDQIIPPHAMAAFRKTLSPAVEVRTYEAGHHMLLRDLQAEVVWRDIADWIEGRLN